MLSDANHRAHKSRAAEIDSEASVPEMRKIRGKKGVAGWNSCGGRRGMRGRLSESQVVKLLRRDSTTGGSKVKQFLRMNFS